MSNEVAKPLGSYLSFKCLIVPSWSREQRFSPDGLESKVGCRGGRLQNLTL